MYKILFVDDERSILDYLPLAIDWEHLGITQIYTAAGAGDALQIVKKERPDIAVVDVEMPEMDGLAFCREAQKLCPQAKFVILSAFDRFDYAKEAIVIGVDDYLLKPVDEGELMALMRQIVEELEERRRDSEESRSRQMRVLEKEVGELVLDMLRQKEPARERKEIHIPEEYENICIVMQENEDGQECGEALRKYMDKETLIAVPENGFYAALWKQDVLESMEQKAADIRQQLLRKGFHVRMHYVRTRRGEDIGQALLRCFYGLERMFYPDSERKRLEKEGVGHMEFSLPDLGEGLSMLSDEGNIQVIRDVIYQVMDDAFACYGEPLKICGMILDIFIGLKIYLTKYWQEDAMDIFRRLDVGTLMRCGSRENLYGLVKNYLEELKLFLAGQEKDCGNAYIVRIAKKYTKEHYQDKGLSLQEVSDAVGISRTYFSKAFKEITGEKYWDYLSSYRIRKAKELLCNTNLGQAEISQRVGYESEFHFSRKFKELVGMSPNKFRRSEQQKNSI